jgi:leader peptidase (prepilin peptidase) / N-methyltransferase
MIFTLNSLTLMFFFVLGAIIGSFLNVVIFRYGTGRSVNGRSKCLSCATKLKWYQMVPILSYIALRGKCANCRTKVSKQYIFVELLTAIVFALLACIFFNLLTQGYLNIFIGAFIFNAVIACCAIVIFVYDMRHMIIPDPFVYAWAALGLTSQLVGMSVVGINAFSVANLLAGPVLFLFFWALWYFSKGTWMGFGDAKLALAIGLTLGFSRGITAIILGFWIGALVGIVLMALSKSKKLKHAYGMKSEVPFGPFLVLGFFLSLFMNLDLVWMSGLFAF